MRLEDVPYGVGDVVRLVSRDSYSWISRGEEVKVTKIENGIFSGDVYTTVESLDGLQHASGHYWRFEY